jgi:hypothetical protein
MHDTLAADDVITTRCAWQRFRSIDVFPWPVRYRHSNRHDKQEAGCTDAK